mgnify:CR=1 FL=1
MNDDNKLKILNNLLTFVLELKSGAKTIDLNIGDIFEGLKQLKENEETPLIKDMFTEYEKFIRLPLAEKHDKIFEVEESVLGILDHYKHIAENRKN